MRRLPVLAALSLAAAACSDGPSVNPFVCDVSRQTGCGAGQFCESTPAGAACFAPVLLRGAVVDPTGAGSLAGVRVVALDPSRAPASSVATSTALGTYELAVRAARDASGRPMSPQVTLRADAQGYQTFPGGARTALPIDPVTAATLVSGRWVISAPQTTLTAIELFPLAGAGDGRIQGTVTRRPGVAAPLVVAEPVGSPGVATATAIAGLDGTYALFNLAPGVSYVVTPYAQGANYAASAPTVPGTTATPAVVDFGAPAPTGAGVTGGLIYRTGASKSVDVELVVESTYLTTLDRGDVPPGLVLHVADNQNYAFAGVPDGHYRVLAAFGIDGDVRDQSLTGNASPPTVTVAGGASAAASASFSVTPAVELVSIGGVAVGATPAVVTTATPAFAWTNAGASNADLFQVWVFDAFGNTMWRPPPEVASASSMSTTYAGDPLTAGQTYQLRIVATKPNVNSPTGREIQSQTEDLLGVFTYRP